MADLILGKDVIAFFRRYADRTKQDAGKVRFQSELSIKQEKNVESTKTKDGVVNSISDGETSGEFKSLAYREDGDTVNMWKEMRKWFKANDKIECWIVDLGSKKQVEGVDKYNVEYYQGYFKNFELSAPSDDKVELSYEVAIDGNGILHTDKLTETQKQAVASAQYNYHTLEKETDGTGVPV